MIKQFDIHTKAISYIYRHCKKYKNVSILEVGGRVDGLAKKYNISRLVRKKYKINYTNIDIKIRKDDSISVIGDICNCPQITDESYDIVLSHNVLEHLKTPWIAAKECIRVNKIGGLNIHIAPFSWHYHETPIDCFRFSHTGLKSLFEHYGNVKEITTGYDIIKNKSSYSLKDNRILDSKLKWSDMHLVLYIGRKIKE